MIYRGLKKLKCIIVIMQANVHGGQDSRNWNDPWQETMSPYGQELVHSEKSCGEWIHQAAIEGGHPHLQRQIGGPGLLQHDGE